MRLVITRCPHCSRITGAQHAESIEDLEKIGIFIKAAKNLKRTPLILDYNHQTAPLSWCDCEESNGQQIA